MTDNDKRANKRRRQDLAAGMAVIAQVTAGTMPYVDAAAFFVANKNTFEAIVPYLDLATLNALCSTTQAMRKLCARIQSIHLRRIKGHVKKVYNAALMDPDEPADNIELYNQYNQTLHTNISIYGNNQIALNTICLINNYINQTPEDMIDFEIFRKCARIAREHRYAQYCEIGIDNQDGRFEVYVLLNNLPTRPLPDLMANMMREILVDYIVELCTQLRYTVVENPFNEINTCIGCNVEPAGFQCGNCANAAYCSTSCQTADWSVHRKICV
jgi:hypothetical protein